MVVISYLGVAQLVARYLGVVEAAGSSPVTQTKKTRKIGDFSLIIEFFLFVFGDFDDIFSFCKNFTTPFQEFSTNYSRNHLRICHEKSSLSLYFLRIMAVVTFFILD